MRFAEGGLQDLHALGRITHDAAQLGLHHREPHGRVEFVGEAFGRVDGLRHDAAQFRVALGVGRRRAGQRQPGEQQRRRLTPGARGGRRAGH
jgi:hypothetical protein